MHITSLNLYEFRNYQRLTLQLSPGITLLYGPNASGKTSLLEALFYLATTRSPRTSTDRELVHWDAPDEAGTPPFARLVASVERAAGNTQLDVVIQLRGAADDSPRARAQATTQKRVRINRKPVRSLDLLGNLRVVLFTPADVTLVTGAPAERRRYLDITLSQIDGTYVRTLARYNKLVQQRNSLLRAWRDQRRPLRAVDDELAYWDKELAHAGGYLLAERLRAVDDLNALAGPLFHNITGSDKPLGITYQASIATAQATTAADLEHLLAHSLRQARRDELQRGQTLLGPHRDDILFTVNTIDLGTYGSRGQQRSVALALKLAEARLMQQRTGEPPVLLLDDLLSELDIQHRTHLLRAIRQPAQQMFLTATDLGNFDADFLQHAVCMRVEAGHIYPAE